MKHGLIQVAMAPFGLILGRNEATRFDRHVYMHPGSALRHIPVLKLSEKQKNPDLEPDAYIILPLYTSLYIPIWGLVLDL